MSAPHRIYLIPGFFGFANLGELRYFTQVRELLHAQLSARSVQAEVLDVATRPTASLPRRAARLLEVLDRTAGNDGGPIHLVGHSTGGLDARLLTAARASLPSSITRERFLSRIRSVVTVATPHRGTPLATFFTTVYGKEMLRLLSLVTLTGFRLGRIPLPAVLALAELLVGRMPGRRLRRGILNQVFQQLLGNFSEERRGALLQFFSEVGSDRALLPQLSPEGMDLFNAQEGQFEGPRYGSVVIRAPRPRITAHLRIGLRAEAQGTYTLFRALHQLTAPMSDRFLPTLSRVQTEALVQAFGDIPEGRDNDAVAPTLSQVWAEVIHAAWADHMDVMGYFGDKHHHPPHVDWLHSESGFDRGDFDALWGKVVSFCLAAS